MGLLCLEQEFRGHCKEGQASVTMSGFIGLRTQTLSGEWSFVRNEHAVPSG